MQLFVQATVLVSALVLVASIPQNLANFEDMFDTVEGPALRTEYIGLNGPVIPLNTFVSGGAGEGKQHLGASGTIPNKQVAIPELHSGYSTPPNPCPKTTDQNDKEKIQSAVHPMLWCYCDDDWQQDGTDYVDCTSSDQCCLGTMSNTAAFVSQYQQTGEAQEQQYVPYNRNKYYEDQQLAQLVAKKSPEIISKRSAGSRRFRTGNKRFNPYLDDQPYMNAVVAKKSPDLSGFPAMK